MDDNRPTPFPLPLRLERAGDISILIGGDISPTPSNGRFR